MKTITLPRGARLACAFTTPLLALAIWLAAPAAAATGSGYTGEKAAYRDTGSSIGRGVASGSLSGTIIRTIVGLLIVIAVIYGLTWVLKQGKASRNAAIGEGLVQVASLPLGTNRSVALVRVGAELHMLGVAEHGISGIRVFSEEEAYELGIPFDPDDFDTPGRSGRPTAQRVVETLRRLTIR
jgi:flagellar protein FliO/FliZ